MASIGETAQRYGLFVGLAIAMLSIPCFSLAQISRYTTGSMSTGRFFHTATRLSDGRVLLVHGLANSSLPNFECELFDPATELFTNQLCIDSIRAQHNAVELPDGRTGVVCSQDPADQAQAQVALIADAEQQPFIAVRWLSLHKNSEARALPPAERPRDAAAMERSLQAAIYARGALKLKRAPM